MRVRSARERPADPPERGDHGGVAEDDEGVGPGHWGIGGRGGHGPSVERGGAGCAGGAGGRGGRGGGGGAGGAGGGEGGRGPRGPQANVGGPFRPGAGVRP